jgi:hypothetical protein
MIHFYIVLFTLITFLLFHYNNSYRKIERYYYNENKTLFVLLEICILVIVFSFLYNIRYSIMLLFQPLIDKLKSKLIK